MGLTKAMIHENRSCDQLSMATSSYLSVQTSGMCQVQCGMYVHNVVSIKLHGFTSQKAVTLIFTSVRTSKHIQNPSLQVSSNSKFKMVTTIMWKELWSRIILQSSNFGRILHWFPHTVGLCRVELQHGSSHMPISPSFLVHPDDSATVTRGTAQSLTVFMCNYSWFSLCGTCKSLHCSIRCFTLILCEVLTALGRVRGHQKKVS